MNKNNINYGKKYDRVMSRVFSGSASSLNSSPNVLRHGLTPSTRLGAKTTVSNVGSGVFHELPVVLKDFKSDCTRAKSVKERKVIKPRKTITSLDPALSPHRPPPKLEQRAGNIRVGTSEPVLLANNGQKWTDAHLQECSSSRSHTKLKELKVHLISIYYINKSLCHLSKRQYYQNDCFNV